MRFREGQLIAGRYRVDQLAGTGSGAEVYKVWDSQRSTFLALKLFRSELKQFPELINRFQDEAHALSRLQHPNIVRFYEMVQRDDLIFFLMDFIEGQTLRQKINQEKGPFEIDKIAHILSPLCAALQYAHHQGIIHCDIKPENILIDKMGTVLITDFGIAEITGSNTEIEGGIGTPAYMSPEQIEGRKLSPQTDQYAVGVILYELLTGVKPFSGMKGPSGLSIRDSIRWEQVNLYPIPLSQINPGLSIGINSIVLKCMQKEPSHRYTNILKLLKDFESKVLIPVVPPIAVTRDHLQKDVIRKPGSSIGIKQRYVFISILAIIVVLLGVMLLTRGGDSSGFEHTTLNLIENNSGTFQYSMACMNIVFRLQPKTDLNECVTDITVQPDGSLQVNVEWLVTSASDLIGVIVYPDTNNKNMYFRDNFGNRLDHIGTGGGTDQEVELFNGQKKEGWFIFPAPDPSATYFYFVDEDNNVRSPRLERKWP